MEVPRIHRLDTAYKQFGVKQTVGEYTGLTIEVTEAPGCMLSHLGLTTDVIFKNQQLEKAAKKAAELALGQVAVPVLMAVSEHA